jgi:hypothetical protein
LAAFARGKDTMETIETRINDNSVNIAKEFRFIFIMLAFTYHRRFWYLWALDDCYLERQLTFSIDVCAVFDAQWCIIRL